MGKKLLHSREVAVALAAVALLVLWQVLAVAIDSPLILPKPR